MNRSPLARLGRERGASALACALSLGIVGALVACSSTAQLPPDDLASGSPQKNPTSSRHDAGTSVLDEADASIPDAEATCQTVPPTNRCGLDPQCGCGPNETCDVTNSATGATSCVTAGSATLGRPCSQTGDCVAGLTCLYGACRPYCKSPRSKCAAPGTDLCVELVDAQGNPEPNMATCTIACDPREPAAVCGTNACLWFPTYYSPSKVSDCNFPGTKTALQPCQADDECAAGLACATHPKYGQECERWCRIGVNGDCPQGMTCKDVFGANAPVIGGVTEGVCQD